MSVMKLIREIYSTLRRFFAATPAALHMEFASDAAD